MAVLDVAHFRDVIKKHNTNIGKLNAWRTSFAGKASQLTDFFLTYPQSSSNSSFWQQNRVGLEQCFKNQIQFRGNSGVFNPWDGWWTGSWQNGSSSTAQYHIWDKTVSVGSQHVQPVTQSTSNFVDNKTIKKAVTERKVDLGINVWSAGNGITGWVSKRQSGSSVELPHIGYSPNAHTLIWITQVDWQGDFYMFFEWVTPSSRQYGIHGKTFRLNGNNIVKGQTTGWTTYNLKQKI